jgi:hypothetical protein
MSLMGQVLLLPHCSTDDRFTPINRLYLKLTSSPEKCHKQTSRRTQVDSLVASVCLHAGRLDQICVHAELLFDVRLKFRRGQDQRIDAERCEPLLHAGCLDCLQRLAVKLIRDVTRRLRGNK